MVVCLEQGADLHTAQLMPLPLTVSCFTKIQIGLPFRYWLTRVVPEKWPLNLCVCVCVDYTHPFNGPLSGTTQVIQYQKGKTNLDFTEARDSEWQWHLLGHTQVCTSLQTDNHTSTPPLSFFYRPGALPAAQPQRQSTEGKYYNMKKLNKLLCVSYIYFHQNTSEW